MVVGKSPGESGRSCRLEGALAVRGHEVFNLICLDTPVEMKACEVRGRGGDYREDLFCVMVVQDQGLSGYNGSE